MHMLIAAATAAELGPLVARFGAGTARGARRCHYTHAGHDIDVLITGVGMVATAAWCSRAFADRRYDLALNLGLCGSFDRSLSPGTVVHVVSDRVSELGAEDGERFLTIEELGLGDAGDVPFGRAELVNTRPPDNAALKRLRTASAISVNTAHGSEQSIARVVERFNPDVESMEGAAFMYACLMHEVPFAQIRAVSNVVERRDRSRWRMETAIAALAAAALAVVEAA